MSNPSLGGWIGPFIAQPDATPGLDIAHVDFIALDTALDELTAVDPRIRRVVQLKFLGRIEYRRDRADADGIDGNRGARLDRGRGIPSPAAVVISTL